MITAEQKTASARSIPHDAQWFVIGITTRGYQATECFPSLAEAVERAAYRIRRTCLVLRNRITGKRYSLGEAQALLAIKSGLVEVLWAGPGREPARWLRGTLLDRRSDGRCEVRTDCGRYAADAAPECVRTVKQ